MDSSHLLPSGLIVNRPEVYDEIAKFDIVPDDKIRAFWNAYTITYKKVRDPTSRRLENFWWHVWGCEHKRLSGPVLARIFKEIATGEPVVPFPSNLDKFVLPPEFVRLLQQHCDREKSNYKLHPGAASSQNLVPGSGIPVPVKVQSHPSTTNNSPLAVAVPDIAPVSTTSPSVDTTCVSDAKSNPSPQRQQQQQTKNSDSFLFPSPSSTSSTTQDVATGPVQANNTSYDSEWTSDSTLNHNESLQSKTQNHQQPKPKQKRQQQQQQQQQQQRQQQPKQKTLLQLSQTLVTSSSLTRLNLAINNDNTEENTKSPALKSPPPPGHTRAEAKMATAMQLYPGIEAITKAVNELAEEVAADHTSFWKAESDRGNSLSDTSRFSREAASDDNITVKRLPLPSSKRPAPKHSILKNNRGQLNNTGAPRPNARFAESERLFQFVEIKPRSTIGELQSEINNVVEDDENDYDQAIVTDDDEDDVFNDLKNLAPEPEARRSYFSAKPVISRPPLKKKGSGSGKGGKKFVASSAAKKKTNLVRRVSSNSGGSGEGGTRINKALVVHHNAGRENMPVDSSNGSSVTNQTVIVHNTRPQLPQSRPPLSPSAKVKKESPLQMDVSRLDPTPEEEENEALVVAKDKGKAPTGKGRKSERSKKQTRLEKLERLLKNVPPQKPPRGQFDLHFEKPVHRRAEREPPLGYHKSQLKPPPVIHRSQTQPAIRRSSSGTFGGPNPILGEQIPFMLQQTNNPARRLAKVESSRPRPSRAHSHMDLPTLAVEVTRRRFEGRNYIKPSASTLSLGGKAPSPGFPPRRRDSNNNDRTFFPAPSAEVAALNLPPFRRSYSSQGHLYASARRSASFGQTPSYEAYSLALGPVMNHRSSTPQQQISAEASTPRSQQLFASPIKGKDKRLRLFSPPVTLTCPITAEGAVYDFDNVDVLLDSERSRIEPIMETDYGLPPPTRVRSLLDPMFVPTERGTSERVPLGRTRSQLMVIMESDKMKREERREGRSVFKRLFSWGGWEGD